MQRADRSTLQEACPATIVNGSRRSTAANRTQKVSVKFPRVLRVGRTVLFKMRRSYMKTSGAADVVKGTKTTHFNVPAPPVSKVSSNVGRRVVSGRSKTISKMISSICPSNKASSEFGMSAAPVYAITRTELVFVPDNFVPHVRGGHQRGGA